jgi:ABC-type ATPase involved in cell division
MKILAEINEIGTTILIVTQDVESGSKNRMGHLHVGWENYCRSTA